jgi:citrate lyase beta subunit
MPRTAADTLAELEHQMQFTEGTVVRINKPFQQWTTEDLFVVSSNNAKTLSLAPLGGGHSGLRAPHRGVTIVDIDVARLQRELATA